MILYYQILDSGTGVRIYKPFFENSNVTEKHFLKKSEVIAIESLEKKIPDRYIKNIIVAMNRIRIINNMKLSSFGSILDEENKKIIYVTGNCKFDDKESAIIHSENIYGREFLIDNINRLDDKKIYYFKDAKEISKEEYDEIRDEYKELRKINKIKIQKENKPSTPKR